MIVHTTRRPLVGGGLPSTARVVVIGGGIAGCSALYHLTELGWTDCLLIEKGELTCGSTWHAAGLCTQFHSSPSVTRLLMRSMDLYERLRGDGGFDVGLKRVGSVRLADSPERLDEFEMRQAAARSLDLPFELIGPDELRRIFPLATSDDVIAAAYLPTDGYVDPSLVTQAMAHHARLAGAEIRTRTAVRGLEQTKDGWRVDTDRGSVDCETVLLAAGMWTRQVAALAGADLPIVPLEHHYVVTEPIDEVRALDRELPVLRDPSGSFYVRQEAESLLVGPFEPSPPAWSTDHVPDDFEGRLLPGRLDQIFDVLMLAAGRVPVFEDAGLKTILNGPDGYTPDGLCLMGEVPGLRGLHVLAGFSIFGIVFGGGAGAYAAEWIVDDGPSDGMSALDVRRFDQGSTKDRFRIERARQTYEREYAIHFPAENLEAGRPARTSALHERMQERGAVHGLDGSFERPMWFSRRGDDDSPSFRLPGWHRAVADECLAVRAGVGVADGSGASIFSVTGTDAVGLVGNLLATPLPPEGSASIGLLLRSNGGIDLVVRVCRPERDRFWLLAASRAYSYLCGALTQHAGRGVEIEDLTSSMGLLTLVGPATSLVLSRLGLPDAADQGIFTGDLARVRSQIVPRFGLGEPAFDILHPTGPSHAVYSAVIEAGGGYGIRDVGSYALDALRLENGWPVWGEDLAGDITVAEVGALDALAPDRDFTGRNAIESFGDRRVERRLAFLEVDPSIEDLYPTAGATIRSGDEPIGFVTSGAFGHTLGAGVALGFLPPEEIGEVTIGLPGELAPASASLVDWWPSRTRIPPRQATRNRE